MPERNSGSGLRSHKMCRGSWHPVCTEEEANLAVNSVAVSFKATPQGSSGRMDEPLATAVRKVVRVWHLVVLIWMLLQFHCIQTRHSLDKCWGLSRPSASLSVYGEGEWPRPGLNPALIDSEMRESAILKSKHLPKSFFKFSCSKLIRKVYRSSLHLCLC